MPHKPSDCFIRRCRDFRGPHRPTPHRNPLGCAEHPWLRPDPTDNGVGAPRALARYLWPLALDREICFVIAFLSSFDV
jgi:hypothetical protein